MTLIGVLPVVGSVATTTPASPQDRGVDPAVNGKLVDAVLLVNERNSPVMYGYGVDTVVQPLPAFALTPLSTYAAPAAR